jgi:hypothetical protein
MLERAKVLERGLTELRKSKLLFKTAAKEADTLEAVGSKIAKSASEKEAQANAQALELVRRLAFTHGPIADALNAAAAKLAAGAKLTDVAAEFARSVKSLISALSPERLPSTIQAVSSMMEQDAAAMLAKRARQFARNNPA